MINFREDMNTERHLTQKDRYEKKCKPYSIFAAPVCHGAAPAMLFVLFDQRIANPTAFEGLSVFPQILKLAPLQLLFCIFGKSIPAWS